MWREVITLTGLHCSMQDAEGIVLKESFVLVKHAHTPWRIPRCQRLNGSLGFCAYLCRRRHTHTHIHRRVKATCGSSTVEPLRNVEGRPRNNFQRGTKLSVLPPPAQPPPTTQHPATQSSPRRYWRRLLQRWLNSFPLLNPQSFLTLSKTTQHTWK